MSSTFAPTVAELALVSLIFLQADPQKLGIITGEAAINVFDGAKVEPNVLAAIWSIADEDNNGWLPRKGVAIAIRLIGWAQKGEKITKALVNKRECLLIGQRTLPVHTILQQLAPFQPLPASPL
jgi:epidermal growth factor receptor substrate 15